jgi:hypothetical protein
MIFADSITTATLAVAGVTLLLAAVTGLSVLIGLRGFYQAGAEIEEAHRPLVVPLDARAKDCAGPHGSGHSTLEIPLENIGTGPALHLVAKVMGAAVTQDGSSAPIGGLRTGARESVDVDVQPSEPPEYVLLLTYKDVAGKHLSTTAQYKGGVFESVTLSTQPLAPQGWWRRMLLGSRDTA